MNEELWKKTKQEKIEKQIKKRKWRWTGHTLRKEGRNSRMRCTRLESPRVLEKRSPTGNMEKDGDKRVGRKGKELE
jgi:hypothetical protein